MRWHAINCRKHNSKHIKTSHKAKKTMPSHLPMIQKYGAKDRQEEIRHGKLRQLRRSFSQSKCTAEAETMELLHYGSVTLIHKKLDSWIDSKPPDLHNKFTCQDDVFTVEDSKSDHKQQRVDRMTKKKGRLARTWSGSMCRLPRSASPSATSLIDSHPNKAPVTDEKRTKPRRISGDGGPCCRNNSIDAKEVLVDKDVQCVCKVILESKLLGRPLIPDCADHQSEGLVAEIKQCKHCQKVIPFYKAVTTAGKPSFRRVVRRTKSFDPGTIQHPSFGVPSSA